MRHTKILTLMIALFALVFAGTASAQLTSGATCGDLTEADCTLLTEATIPSSAAFNGDGTLDVTVDGVPYSVGLATEGRYITDETLLAEYLDLMAMTQAEQAEQIYSDPEALVTFITDFFQLVDSNMTLGVSLPSELTGGMFPSDYALDLWLIDGAAYADLADLSEIDPSLMGVYGLDLVALYTDLFNEPETAEVLDMIFDGDVMDNTGLFDPSFAEEYSTVERLDDTTINGAEVAVFETTIDYGALFGSEQVAELLTAQFEAQMSAMEDAGMSDAEMDALDVDAVLDLYATLFDGATFTTTQAVGLENSYTYETTTAFSMDVDGATLAEGFAEMAGDPTATDALGPIPSFTVDFDFTVTQSDFDVTTDIALPEGSQLLPLDALGM